MRVKIADVNKFVSRFIQRSRTQGVRVVNTLLPVTCRACNQVLPGPVDTLVCHDCWNQLEFFEDPFCETCGAPTGSPIRHCPQCGVLGTSLDEVLSCGPYTTPLREFILAFKFYGSHRARPVLEQIFSERLQPRLKHLPPDCIIPVPLHPWRQFAREFNQAAVLAEALAQVTGVPCHPHGLRRTRLTVPQSKLTGSWREKNLDEAFTPGEPPAQGQRVVLVDDVLTSGRTLQECARVLKAAGAVSVVACTLARRLRAVKELPGPPLDP